MSDKATQDIRTDLRYNSTDMGELGRFIRLDYVYNILDRYVIFGRNAGGEIEAGRIAEIRKLLFSAGDAESERQVLQAIYQIVNP